jgi:hypothetical protein
MFLKMISLAEEQGMMPEDYDMRNNQVKSEIIDVDYSGRSWTYQYCTEFGFF